MLEGAGEGNLCIADSWPGQMRTVYGDHERFVETYFSPIRANISPATAAAATPMAITGSPAGSTTSSMSPAIAWARPRSRVALVAHSKVSEAAVVGYPARHQGPRHLRLCHPDGRRGADRGAAQGARRLGAPGDRTDRLAGLDPVRAGPAEDPVAARSCAGSCARSPKTNRHPWAIPRRSPILGGGRFDFESAARK